MAKEDQELEQLLEEAGIEEEEDPLAAEMLKAMEEPTPTTPDPLAAERANLAQERSEISQQAAMNSGMLDQANHVQLATTGFIADARQAWTNLIQEAEYRLQEVGGKVATNFGLQFEELIQKFSDLRARELELQKSQLELEDYEKRLNHQNEELVESKRLWKTTAIGLGAVIVIAFGLGLWAAWPKIDMPAPTRTSIEQPAKDWSVEPKEETTPPAAETQTTTETPKPTGGLKRRF